MKYFFSKIIVLLLSLYTNAQNASFDTCVFVSYMESNDSGSLLEHWFYFDRTIYTIKDIQPAMPSSIIIQKPDGSREMLTDTILYAKDFANAKESILKARESIKQWIKIRNYDINILKEIQYDHNNIKYLLIDTLRKMTEWQLLDDTSFVLGIKCQKAITNFYGTNYTAWFTQLYPISAGPRNFRGLPGLILKVSNEKTGFSIEAVEIQYPAKQKSPRVEMDGKPISKSAFDAIIEKQNEASMRMLEQYTH